MINAVYILSIPILLDGKPERKEIMWPSHIANKWHGSHLQLSNLASNTTSCFKHFSTHLLSGFLEVITTLLHFGRWIRRGSVEEIGEKNVSGRDRTASVKERTRCAHLYMGKCICFLTELLWKISKIKRVGTHVPVPGTLRELSEIEFWPKTKSMSVKYYPRALWDILTLC